MSSFTAAAAAGWMFLSCAAVVRADAAAPPAIEQLHETCDVGLLARAASTLQETLQRDPKNVPAMVKLGSVRLAQHRCRDAMQLAEQALAVKPQTADALGLRADALVQLGELGRAREDCEKLLAAKPDLLAQLRMGQLQFAEGDAQAAIASFEAAVDAGENDHAPAVLRARALVQLGETRFRTGAWDEAEQAYQAALKLRNDDDADAHDHMAELLAARGEFEEAIKHSDRAIEKCRRPEFRQARGDIHAAMNDLDATAQWHEKALAAYVADVDAGGTVFVTRIARMYCDVPGLRDPVQALRWARRGVQASRNVDTLDALAWAMYQSEKYDDAAEAMDKALRQRTADADVLYHAGLIYSHAGGSRKGATYLRRAALANPKFNEFHFRR